MRHPLCLLLLLSLVAACAPSDPVADVLAQRARWEVLPQNWVQDEEGALTISVRLAGPARSSIETLTVRVEVLDAAGEAVAERWYSFGLTDIERGGPADRTIRLRDVPVAEDVKIDTVPAPTDEQWAQIKELQGL